MLADANDSLRAAKNPLGHATTPFSGSSVDLVGGISIETVDRDDVGHVQFLAEEHCRLPARQRSVRVDHVNLACTMHSANSRDQARKEERSGTREPYATRQRKVAQQFGRRRA